MDRLGRRLGWCVTAAALTLWTPGCSGEDEAAPTTSVAQLSSTSSVPPATDAAASSTTVEGGAEARCKGDTRTLRTAEEAFLSQTGRYATTTGELVNAGMLAEESTMHEIVIPAAVPGPDGVPPPAYDLVIVDPACGTPGHRPGQTPADH